MSGEYRIDVLASHWHYLDHMAPIWRALPEDRRGDVLLERPSLRAHPLAQEASGRVRNARSTAHVSRVLVAGMHDANVASRCGWGVALLEHGSGQMYDGDTSGAKTRKRSSSNAGGTGRQSIGLFLCTNEPVRQANEALYGPRAVVCGSPRLGALEHARALHVPAERPTLALAWHWACNVAPPWSQWLLPEFRPALRQLRSLWKGDIIGHCHPRAWHYAEQAYREVGIEPVQHWSDVVMRADVVSFDNTSVGWEAAALGIPVVLCETPKWKRTVEHGLRFWTYADIGPTVADDTYPEALAGKWVDAAVRALTERDVYAPRMAAMAEAVYPERKPDIAVDALLRWIGA